MRTAATRARAAGFCKPKRESRGQRRHEWANKRKNQTHHRQVQNPARKDVLAFHPKNQTTVKGLRRLRQ